MDLDYEIMDGSPWLPCEDDYIRSEYAKGSTLAEIGRGLKRSPRSVGWRARRTLKLRHPRAGGKSGLSPEEHKWAFLDDAIRALYCDGGSPAVQEVHPYVDTGSIAHRARHLGIRRAMETPAHRTPEAIERLMREAQVMSLGALARKYRLNRSQVWAAIRDGRQKSGASA